MRPSCQLPGPPGQGCAFRRLPRGWQLAVAVAAAGSIATALWLLLRTMPEAVDPTWERIRQSGVLRVCTDPSWPPFESIDAATGQMVGIDVELADILARRLAAGVRAEIVTVGFDGLYDALLTGRCDAILSAIPYEPTRTQDVAYSVAYFNAGLVLVTRQGTTGAARLEDLKGRVVGVEWGFVPEGDSRRRLFFQQLGLRRYDTPAEALRALQSGELDAVLVDRVSALAYRRECGGVRIVGEPISDLNYVIPVRPDSFRLLAEINRALLEMRRDGTLSALTGD